MSSLVEDLTLLVGVVVVQELHSVVQELHSVVVVQEVHSVVLCTVALVEVREVVAVLTKGFAIGRLPDAASEGGGSGCCCGSILKSEKWNVCFELKQDWLSAADSSRQSSSRFSSDSSSSSRGGHSSSGVRLLLVRLLLCWDLLVLCSLLLFVHTVLQKTKFFKKPS